MNVNIMNTMILFICFLIDEDDKEFKDTIKAIDALVVKIFL